LLELQNRMNGDVRMPAKAFFGVVASGAENRHFMPAFAQMIGDIAQVFLCAAHIEIGEQWHDGKDGDVHGFLVISFWLLVAV